MRSRPVEPEWDDEQQGWMVALSVWRAELHDCGHPLSESTDPANENGYRVPPPTRCHACDALLLTQQKYADEDVRRPQALVWRVDRRG